MTEQNGVVAEPTTEEAVTPEAQPEQEAKENQTDTGQVPEGEKPEGEEKAQKPRETPAERRERQRAARERQKAELEQANSRLDRIKKASQGTEEPKREDFDDPDDYTAARAAFSGAQAMAQHQIAAAQSEVDEVQQRHQAESDRAWSEQTTDARARYQDFDAKVGDPNLPIAPHVAEVIKTSEMGADVAYHLAGNHAEALRISRMDPVSAAREIGRIEAVLSVPQPKTETKAPPPIETLDGGTQPSTDPSKMTPDQYRAWRQAGGGF